MSNLHIVVVGASGRTGSRICALALQDASLSLVGAVVSESSASIGQTLSSVHRARYSTLRDAAHCDVLIDFSTPSALPQVADYARTTRCGVVVGTTGHRPEHDAILRDLASIVPVLRTPNTSIGVAAVARTVADLARALGTSYRASIVETHHIHKKDAPSGTAKRLAAAARSAGADLPDDQVHAVRAGDVVGTHVVTFHGPGETIEVIHRATSRDLFALGALRAAKWIAGKPPALYTLDDTL